MIRVYADLECGARCITFKDEQAPELLELVRAFDDEEREAAWALLHELGHMFTRTPRPAGPPAARARSATATTSRRTSKAVSVSRHPGR